MQSGLEAASVAAFLHESMHAFINEQGAEGASVALEYLSSAGKPPGVDDTHGGIQTCEAVSWAAVGVRCMPGGSCQAVALFSNTPAAQALCLRIESLHQAASPLEASLQAAASPVSSCNWGFEPGTVCAVAAGNGRDLHQQHS